MCSLFCFKDQTSFFEFTPLYGLYPVVRSATVLQKEVVYDTVILKYHWGVHSEQCLENAVYTKIIIKYTVF